ncbi:MAG: cell surface protein [Bacteroides sp.]|nr:cell surface protein [Bacteroides sp.]MCM1378673.1 cell surface protein [Bacteroides sp.]MCM1444946.1 cell surface protein [Prevotella sp.]
MKRLLPILLTVLLLGCKDDVPMVNLGIENTYYIARMQKLALDPALTGKEYVWTVNGEVVSHQRDYIFLASEEGTYFLTFEIIDDATPFKFDFTVHVLHEEIEYSPYIARVLEYCPAPGQFVNEMPMYEQGDTYADILQKAEESISGTNDIMITLGGWGGYVTFAFDHTVINVEGEMDFRIWGNAFYELTNPDTKGGSAEPGIVMVSYDTNCNGLPDDPWYELAGSEYANEQKNYSMTYTLPESGDIPWVDTDGQRGYIYLNNFHTQSYFPQWLNANQLTFNGSLLPDNGIDQSGNGTYYVLYSFDWGYVDNHPNDYPDLNSFDIGWAVDSAGNKVNLPGADFIRVYTGLNQSCGWLGETSTELSRAQDLHIDLLTN